MCPRPPGRPSAADLFKRMIASRLLHIVMQVNQAVLLFFSSHARRHSFVRAVVSGKTICALAMLTLATSTDVCVRLVLPLPSPRPAPPVAFTDGTYDPAAGPVKLPRPLSRGSLRPFA